MNRVQSKKKQKKQNIFLCFFGRTFVQHSEVFMFPAPRNFHDLQQLENSIFLKIKKKKIKKKEKEKEKRKSINIFFNFISKFWNK